MSLSHRRLPSKRPLSSASSISFILAALLACASGAASAAPTHDSASLSQTVERAAALPRLRALIVAHDGVPVVERVFRGPGLDRPVNVKSVSKTILSALVGAAIERGTLSGVDQKIAPLLGARVPSEADPRVGEITIGHLLSMRAGLERTSGQNYGRWASSRDWVRYALSRPFVDEPGGRMLYSTGNSHLLSTILTRVSRRSTLDLARDWLGGPLGVAIPPWTRDPQGVYFGGNEMSLSPRAMLRFGEMYRNCGMSDGRRVLAQDWVRRSWTPQGRSFWTGHGYGYGWFITSMNGHSVYYAWGHGGQMIYVVPGLKLTIVTTSDSIPGPDSYTHSHDLHRLVEDGVLPAFEADEAAAASCSAEEAS